MAGMQRWLRTRGLRQGDRVALMLGNSLEHMSLIYALMLSGMVWVPVNTKLRGAGLRYVFEHARPALIVTDARFESLASVEVSLQHRMVAVPQPDDDPTSQALEYCDVEDTDTLCLLYTSGTTGSPKGVQFTHRMMRIAAESALMVADVREGDRLFMWEPLCHIGGAQLLLMPFMLPVQLHAVEQFSASRFWDQWTQARATHLHYLGGILDILIQRMSSDPSLAAIDRKVSVAWGAGLSKMAWPIVEERLGCRIRECYGMTECSSFATYNTTGKPGSIGRALPWLDIQLQSFDGKEVAPGETGQIVLSSRLEGALFPGYFDDPAATAQALRGGKLFTGDLARQDFDGDYTFVGRLTDSMRVRGENVSAWEVERVFLENDAIAACAAVGISAEVGEQEILLYVQYKEGQAPTWEALVAWAEPRMAKYQMPRFYRAVTSFELTPSERIRKHTLSRDTDDAWEFVVNADRQGETTK